MNSVIMLTYDVLKAMKEIGTLEEYDLLDNYNYYDDSPIEMAKAKFLGQSYRRRNYWSAKRFTWMKDRSLKDKNNNLYIVKDFVSKRNDTRKNM